MSRGIVLVAALVCALSGTAFADNKEAAKEAYTEGKRQYDLGEYDAALAAFKKAYLNYEEPVFLFNIAQCYRAIGDKAAAARTYRAFLRNWPKAPNKEQVERIVAQLDAAIAQDASAKAAPPPDTLAPAGNKTEVAKAPATTAPATSPSTTAPPATTAKPAPKPEVASATPAPPGNAPPPANVEEPKPKAKPAPPPKDELAGMVEVEPNFDRPSGSSKPLKWWAWTLLAVGIAGVGAAAAAIAVTQTSSTKFASTLPDFTVTKSALHALEVRF
jgi:tetratricopeptide (TPR) repeat protein